MLCRVCAFWRMNWIDGCCWRRRPAAFKGWSGLHRGGGIPGGAGGPVSGQASPRRPGGGMGSGSVVRNAVVAFFITFLVVILARSSAGPSLTTVIDVARLGLPNKAAGVLFGALRSVFMLSILLNLVPGYERAGRTRIEVEASRLHARSGPHAPMVFPDPGSTKWVNRAMDSVRDEADRVLGNSVHAPQETRGDARRRSGTGCPRVVPRPCRCPVRSGPLSWHSPPVHDVAAGHQQVHREAFQKGDPPAFPQPRIRVVAGRFRCCRKELPARDWAPAMAGSGSKGPAETHVGDRGTLRPSSRARR